MIGIPTPTIRVLLTEDVPADAELEVRELKRAGLRIAHRIVDSEQAFVQAAREFAPDIILSDFSMPSFDGMAALSLARQLCPEVPFIFVSGTIGEEYAIRALKNGATDYVLKTNLVRLPAAVERALAEAKERRERRKVEIELELVRGRLASIIDSLPDVLWSVQLPSEDILYIGPTSREIFGREAQDFLTDRDLWINVVHPDDRPAMLAAWRAMLAEGRPFDVEYRVLRPDGGERWVNDRGHIVRDSAGVPYRIDGVTRDITEQIGHRRRIERLSRIRDFTSSINSTLVRERERGALFDEICRIAVEVGRFAGAHVGVLRSDGMVQWVAKYGTSVAHLDVVAVSMSSDAAAGRTIGGIALRTGKPAWWNDVAQDAEVPERDRPRFLASGIAAAGSFPLIVDAKPVALLGLHAREAGFFDQDELSMLEELTANISFALELIGKQDQVTYLALYDPATGLPNRTLFHERLSQALADPRSKLGLLITDLERFKAINDTHGRQIGDALLKAVAQRLRDAAGDLGRLARLGSNVFGVMFPNIAGAENVARGLEGANVFGAPFQIEGHEIRVTARTGIALSPEDGADADTLFRNAEAALKRAKETGERYLFYAPSINARVSEQVELEHRLRKAVENGELFLHFQPKLDLASGEIVGLEALMRWHGPDGQLVSPVKFVPVLEQTGLIFEAGQQVIAAAQRQYAAWRAKRLAAPRIAVNVSAVQLRRRTFVQDVQQALAGAGGDGGGGVDMEITESLLMSEVDSSIRKLRELREMGLRLALDDFGTGYSSLAYLSKLPLDTLKIDRSFVHGMTDHADHTSIISAIISLGQALRLKVVAEGVETEQQAQLLRLLRCEQAQGFLFSPPLPAEQVEGLLKAL